MKSRKRCLTVALWLAIPIAVSLQLTTAFRSEVVLEHCGLITAALNLPGFLLEYWTWYRVEVPALTLIAAGDFLFYVPVIYGLLRWQQRRVLRR